MRGWVERGGGVERMCWRGVLLGCVEREFNERMCAHVGWFLGIS